MDYELYLKKMYHVAVKHGNTAEAANIADEYQQMYGKEIDMGIMPKKKSIKQRISKRRK